MAAPGFNGSGGDSSGPGFNGSSGGGGGFGSAWSAPQPVLPVGAGAGKPPEADGPSPGTFGVDVTSPQGVLQSMQQNVLSAQQYTQGLSAALFGVHQAGTQQENQGGVPLLSDFGRAVGRVPILGTAVGAVGEAAGAVAGTLGTAGAAVASPVVNELASEAARTTTATPEVQDVLRKQFAAIPDSPEKQAVEQAIAADPDTALHQMYDFGRKYASENNAFAAHPDLYPDLKFQPVTLADSLTQVTSVLGDTSRAGQRIVGGAEDLGIQHLSRMDGIDQVARGLSVFEQGQKGMTDSEKVAWQNWSNGTWSIDEAYDFLAAANEGVTHDARLQIASSVALDPQVFGSVGAAALSKLGIVGVRLTMEGVEQAGKATFGQVMRSEAARLTDSAVSLTEKEGSKIYNDTLAMAKLRGVPVGDLPPEAWEQLASQSGKSLTAQQVEEAVLRSSQAGRNISPVNFLGQLSKTSASAKVVRILAIPSMSVQQAKYWGQTAKVVRSIIDPFSLLGGKGVVSEASTGVLSEAAPRIVDDAYGHLASAQVVHFLHGIKPGLGLDDAAGYAANLAREVATDDHIASQFAAAGLERGQASIESLRRADVNAIAEAATANAPKTLWDKLKLRAVEVRPALWGETEQHDLAMRLHAAYSTEHGGNGPASVDEWLASLAGRSDDQLAKLHGMTFQNLSSKLSDAIGQATARIGQADADALGLKDVYLMRRGTLTAEGVGGILKRMSANAANLDAQVAEMKLAQETYPELRFIPFREVNPSESVDDFIRWLEGEQRDGRFPTQLLDREIEQLPDEVQDVDRLISGTFSLAKRPATDGLMGLSRDASGRLARAYAPWVDRVSNGTVKAHGTFASDHNILGLPLLSTPLGKPIDVIDAGLKTARGMVQTEAIAVRATQRFQAQAADKFGMAPEESKKLIAAVQEAAHNRAMTVRGLRAENMQAAVKGLLPRGSKMQVADILNMVLEAYEGDLRYVGLTQKLTGRAKVLFGKSGSNFAGMVSEDLYPKIRFQYNLVFQGQEKIEPWVLSAQRGVMPIFGTKMTEADKFAAIVAENLRDTGMVRAASVDAAEWSSYVVAGSDIKAVLGRTVDPSFFSELRDVRGTKFVNMNRAAAEASAPRIRAVLDQNMPGYFDRLVEYDSARMGYPVSDTEALAHWLNEGGLTHGVEVPDVLEPGIGAKLFGDHIRVGEVMRPVDIGELRALDLNYWAGRLGVVEEGGRILTDEAGLRAALARQDSGVTVDTLRNALLEHGAHPTQAERVVNSLNFNYNTFVNTLTERYHLDGAESRRVEDLLARMASERDMSPADYISQVFSPTLRGGTEASIGQLGGLVDVMRSGRIRQEGDLAQLAATRDAQEADLMNSLATVFSAHLDPSARWTLLQEFQPELRQAVLDGRVSTDLATLDDMWAQGADHWLAQQLMDYKNQTALAQTIEDYTRVRPGFPRPMRVYDAQTLDKLPDKVQGSLGDGLRTHASPEVRAELLSEMDRLHQSVPGVETYLDIKPLHEIDPESIAEGTADGATYQVTRTPGRGYVVYLDDANFGPETRLAWEQNVQREGVLSRQKTFNDIDGSGQRVPRRSNQGAPYSADPSMLGVLRHEHGHAVHEYIKSREDLTALNEWLDIFSDTNAAKQLSETARMNTEEGAAEVISLATDPEADLTRFNTRPSAAQSNFDDLPPLSDTEYWRDVPVSERPDFDAGGPQTVEEAVTELRGLMEQAGLLRQPSAVTPDVARASQMFGRWTTNVIRDGLKLENGSAYSDLLARIALIPTKDAVPYNLMHGLMVQQVENAMVRGSEDAFRLNFFKQNRSWVERSLNHPFFGIYPASYMWGKIAPELARFMMVSPFGVRTGAASYVARDFAQALAARQETDTDFQKQLEGVDKSDIAWFMSYMLPALPWDVGAAAPGWTRDLAEQGLKNQARVDKGAAPKPVNLSTPIGKVADYVSPFRQVDQLQRPLKELGDDIFGDSKAQKLAAQKSYVPPQDDGITQGTELGNPLEQAAESLQTLFSGR